MPDLEELIGGQSEFFDSAVIEHGYAPFNRDYDVVVDVPAATPDGSGSYIAKRLCYRFTHCPVASLRTAIEPSGVSPGATCSRTREVMIETNTFVLRLIFHDLTVVELPLDREPSSWDAFEERVWDSTSSRDAQRISVGRHAQAA